MTRYLSQKQKTDDLNRIKSHIPNPDGNGVISMSLSLPISLLQRVNIIVDEGDYVSRSAFVRECIRLQLELKEKGLRVVISEAVKSEINKMIQSGFIIVRENRKGV